jgi:hypothetical protein
MKKKLSFPLSIFFVSLVCVLFSQHCLGFGHIANKSNLELSKLSPLLLEVNAGPNQTICEDDYAQLNGSANNYTELLWVTNGDGFFDDPTILNPVYTPGGSDITFGYVELCLIASDGTKAEIEDCMAITIQAAPYAYAGPDHTHCFGLPYQLNGVVEDNGAIMWVTAGFGVISNPSIPNPVYYPNFLDLIMGPVNLCLTATPLTPCTIYTQDCMALTIVECPTVDAGSDGTSCGESPYQLNGSATNYSSVEWSGGTGDFDNPNSLSAKYTSAPGEVGAITLTLTAYSNAPAAIQVSDDMVLFIIQAPSADAGPDLTICDYEEFVTLDGTCLNGSFQEWTTADGTGFFADRFSCDTYYYPQPMDIVAGSVTLCLTVFPVNPPCTIEDQDCMTLTITTSPTADAGDDAIICEGDSYQLNGFATNYSTLFWTGGDGTFNNATILNPIYTAGPVDAANGGVDFCLTAYPTGGCMVEAVDCIYLTIIPQPNVDLGTDRSLACDDYDFINSEWSPIAIFPVIANSSTVQWTTNGTGYFDNPLSVNTEYYMSTADIWNGEIEICLEVSNPNCPSATDCITIYVPKQLITFDQNGWYGISSYLNPYLPAVPEVLYPLVGPGPSSNHLELVKNIYGEVYWPYATPGISINNLGDWEPNGYKAKIINQPDCLPIFGDSLTDQTFEIHPGYNYLPVLTNFPVNLNEFFADHLDDILLIYDWHTAALWTPGPEPDPLETIKPGFAYLLITHQSLTNSFTIEFPDYNLENPPYVDNPLWPNQAIAKKPMMKIERSGESVASIYSSHWNDIAHKDSRAIFHLNSQGIEGIETVPGQDTIGLFNEAGACVGTETFTFDSVPFITQNNNDEINGDYPGFTQGEFIEVRLYQPTFNREFILNYEYQNYFSIEKESKSVAYFDLDGFGEFNNLSYQEEVHRIELPKGWNGISSYLLPEQSLLDNIFNSIDTSVQIMTHQTGFYWPSQNINTIGNWDAHEGYAIKMNDEVELSILGHMVTNKTINLPQGWSMIPVLTSCPLPTTDLMAALETDLVLIKEIAGQRVFWPELNIATLLFLEPGNAYYLLVNNSASFTFPDCSSNPKSNNPIVKEINVPGWGNAKKTPSSHTFGIVSKNLFNNQFIHEGDIIGAFDENGHCFGKQEISTNNTSLLLFGDDLTTKEKDGFTEEERVLLRLYCPDSFEEFSLSYSLSIDYPEYEKLYKDQGVSVIKDIKISSLGNSKIEINSILDVYPNPSSYLINITILNVSSGENLLEILDVNGIPIYQTKLLKKDKIFTETICIPDLSPGLYFIKNKNEYGRIVGKGKFIFQ